MITPDSLLTKLTTLVDREPIAYSDEGEAILRMSDDAGIYIQKIGSGEVEFSFHLDDLDFPDDIMMSLMLEANSLGRSVGSARFAIDSDGTSVHLRDRWRIEELDEAGVETRFRELVESILFWQTDGSELLLAASAQARSDRESSDQLRSDLGSDQISTVRV